VRGFVLGVLFCIVVAIGAFFAIVNLGVIPAATRGGPVPLERYAARTSLRATLDREAPKDSPVPLTDANLISGINLYGPRCAVCHGLANGDPTAIRTGEYPRPPLLGKDGVEDDPIGWTFWKIKNGIRWSGMPAWSDDLTDDQIWRLALFLKHMDHLPPAAQAAWRALKGPGEARPPASNQPSNAGAGAPGGSGP
jgi:mono/diheme cytochrome c family protein